MEGGRGERERVQVGRAGLGWAAPLPPPHSEVRSSPTYEQLLDSPVTSFLFMVLPFQL